MTGHRAQRGPAGIRASAIVLVLSLLTFPAACFQEQARKQEQMEYYWAAEIKRLEVSSRYWQSYVNIYKKHGGNCPEAAAEIAELKRSMTARFGPGFLERGFDDPTQDHVRREELKKYMMEDTKLRAKYEVLNHEINDLQDQVKMAYNGRMTK